MLFEKQIKKIYRNNLFVRNDNRNGIFYFSPADFPGLNSHRYIFKAKAGHDLVGYFYYYETPIPGRVLVFDHGMGNGHRAYMREIEQLCKGGFLVFSYDHTGCMESGGESTNGFAQSLSDLDACITALKAEKGLIGRSFCVIGHSWGGFSTMNIAALHPDITHVVSMSGFISVDQILKQTFSGILKGYNACIYALESKVNPDYAGFHAAESLKNTRAKVLLIHSDDDSVVKRSYHFDILQEALSSQKNIQFLLLHGKDHNPTYATDAVIYKNEFFKELQQRDKKKLLQTPQQQAAFMEQYDWHRMTQQDEAVWNIILDMLKSE